MEKLSSFFIGVVDFFAALLPGVATVLVLLALAPSEWLALIKAQHVSEQTAIAALLGAGFILGQAMNALGSYVLDVVYDAFYAPKYGVLVGATKGSSWRKMLAKVHDWKFPLGAFVAGLIEKDTQARADDLKDELDRTAGPSPSKGVYGRIRSYFCLAMPAAFEQVERLESEQKFFRTATVATCVIAVVAVQQGRASWWMWLLMAFFLTRYISRRRKTIERAYMFFGLRALAREPRAKRPMTLRPSGER